MYNTIEEVDIEINKLISLPPCEQCGDHICWCDGEYSDASKYEFLIKLKTKLETFHTKIEDNNFYDLAYEYEQENRKEDKKEYTSSIFYHHLYLYREYKKQKQLEFYQQQLDEIQERSI